MAFIPPIIRHPVSACMTPQSSPLDNLRVLVTAPAPYATRLAPLLIEKHAKPIWMPSIRTTTLTDSNDIDTLQAELLQLPQYQVLAFTSRTAMKQVVYHLNRLTENDPAAVRLLFEASGTKIAALGNDALSAKDILGVTVDIIPLEPSPLGMVRFMAADPSLSGASVLCPVPKVVGMDEPSVIPDFLAALKQCNFHPTPVSTYETSPVRRAEVQHEIDLLLRGAFDAVVFSSSGEAYALRQLLTEEERGALSSANLVFAAHGPFAAHGVKEALDIENVVVSEDYSSFEGVIAALERTFQTRHGDKTKLVIPVQ